MVSLRVVVGVVLECATWPIGKTLAGDLLIGLNVAGAGSRDNICWQCWGLSVACSVPTGGGASEPVTHILLIEAGLNFALTVLVSRPVAGGVRGENFVTNNQCAVLIAAKLEFSIGQDNACLLYTSPSPRDRG